MLFLLLVHLIELLEVVLLDNRGPSCRPGGSGSMGGNRAGDRGLARHCNLIALLLKGRHEAVRSSCRHGEGSRRGGGCRRRCRHRHGHGWIVFGSLVVSSFIVGSLVVSSFVVGSLVVGSLLLLPRLHPLGLHPLDGCRGRVRGVMVELTFVPIATLPRRGAIAPIGRVWDQGAANLGRVKVKMRGEGFGIC